MLDNLIADKKVAKAKMAEEMGFSGKKPLVGIFLDRALEEKDEKVIKELFKAVGALEVNVVILGEEAFKEVHCLDYNRANRKKLLNAADMAVAFGFNDVEEMFFNGVIPVSCEREEAEDYNPNKEKGNSFIYKKDNVWGIFAALVRAVETFKFPYDWKHIIREALKLRKV